MFEDRERGLSAASALLGSKNKRQKKKKSAIKLRSVKVDETVSDDFDLLCKHIFKSNFSEQVNAMMREQVDDYRRELEQLKKKLREL